jgi:hypothetical protein
MDDETIDNISPSEEGSILAWFSRQRMERAAKKALFEEGTIESNSLPAKAQLGQLGQVGQLDPPADHEAPASLYEKLFPNRRVALPPDGPPSIKRHYEHEDNIVAESSFVENVPGFIFVTSGHSSSVQTRSGSKASTSRPSNKSWTKGDVIHEENRASTFLSTKTVLSCLVLAVVMSVVMLAVIFTSQNKEETQSTSSFAAGAPPTLPPFPIIPISTLEPSSVNRQPPGPFDESSTANTPSTGQTSLPIKNSTLEESDTTPSPTKSEVMSRLEELAPDSAEAWMDPDSPQILAAQWVMNDADAMMYSDSRLLQRYVLATLFFSTNGEEWTKSSLSWMVEWSDECTWWGIECNVAGGVRIIRLSQENLSGPLPPEIHLISDSLEELYLDRNSLTGPIPEEVSLLTNLRTFLNVTIAYPI